MKIVIHTQVRENYGAHDWDGKGECPQRWKYKGGNTFVVHGVSIEDNMSVEWWQALEAAVEYRNESFEEYIIGADVVDDVDFVESDHVQEWDSPINLVFSEGRFLATRYTKADFTWQGGIVAKMERWVQVAGDREDYLLMYEREDGDLITYKEWVAEQEAA